jgi:transcriptional regulator with XRE-family HTH domain
MILLKKIRQERNISQVKLCQLTGISQADISAIENGWKRPFSGWKKRIALALGVSDADADSLFEEVSELKAVAN